MKCRAILYAVSFAVLSVAASLSIGEKAAASHCPPRFEVFKKTTGKLIPSIYVLSGGTANPFPAAA
jgi:hypothetical protein